ncbi:nuclear transport factor 2 family protein [Asanoa sp. WMMD1127]|uniref:nuclear transport factor 2 family protein n=1 Tax=Asanoa sp. WMMD1127 TaxID=3016107 RepID=UPI002416C27E|nr:nuclear transport factor 2 family protein [Asanoa sp. WMMD1127]MDG4824772.1 nuclear transport factor 2 family protein [Asanoa sp. WMMD1127]
MTEDEFFALLAKLADAWTAGRSTEAADCFTDDIIYIEPPDRQRYVGRAAIYELSGGDAPPPMWMTLHNLAFNEATQSGFAEYTFRGRRQYHGITFVSVRDGRIHRWREYQYANDQDWPAFAGEPKP